ncbi:MAG: helix-turn-helix domain-containing protein [Chloroflexi bacterium]|nr:helix-turn-helix domain-containing protein [Chloroflexota bacterium]
MHPPAAEEFEIDVELLSFVHRYASGPLKWDLLLFFGQNTYTRDTAEAIARRIGRRPQTVARELQDLAIMGVVQAHRLSGSAVFALAPSPKLRDTLSRFVAHTQTQALA